MKKALGAMVLMLIVLFGISALAEEIVLPDPGYYFGRSYDGWMIEFDEYPKEEFDAYTSLLIDKYGMEIYDHYVGKNDEFYDLTMPGAARSEAFVSCFLDTSGVFGMEFYFSKNITLSALEVYESGADEKGAEIAWDDGRMIADPGDFLGYEILVTDILDMTDYKYGGYYFTRYFEEIDMYDLLKYVDALDASPYFEISETSDARSASYRIINFLYTGPDAELAASCKAGHKNKRTSDLYIHIDYRDRERSSFRITTYPGFTVNSPDHVPSPDPDPNPDPSIFTTCSTCNGDGECNYCWGRGYHWNDKNQDCSVCRGSGKCSSCGGKGRK